MLSTCSGPIESDLKVSERLDGAAIGRCALGRRTSEGGYCFYRTPEWAVEEPNAPDTLAALELLRLLEIDLPVPQRTGLWLRSLQDSRGGYPTLTIGWAALRALDVLAVEPACSPDHWLRAWVEVLASRDRPRDQRAAIVDASHVVELVRLRRGTLRGCDRDGIAALFDTSRIPYEGWARPGADLETTAKAVRLAQLMDVHWHSDVELVTFLRRCEDELLGLQLAPGVRGNRCRSAAGRAQAEPRPRPKYPLSRRRRTTACPAALLQRLDGGLGARHRAISTLQARSRR